MKKFITEYLTIKANLNGDDTRWVLVERDLYFLWSHIEMYKVKDNTELWIKDKLLDDIKDFLVHVKSKISYN